MFNCDLLTIGIILLFCSLGNPGIYTDTYTTIITHNIQRVIQLWYTLYYNNILIGVRFSLRYHHKTRKSLLYVKYAKVRGKTGYSLKIKGLIS